MLQFDVALCCARDNVAHKMLGGCSICDQLLHPQATEGLALFVASELVSDVEGLSL